MTPAKSIKEQIEKYVLEHPSDSFNVESLLSVMGKHHRPQVEAAIKEFRKRNGIFKPLLLKDSFKDGFFRLNPEYKTLEQMRKDAETAGKERVATNGTEWKPTQPAITAGEHSSLIHRRRHFKSIVDRMLKSPAFSPADVDFLKSEAEHLIEPLKEAKIQAASQ